MLDAGSSLCKPFGEIAVDEIWIKLHLTKLSLVQSVNYLNKTKRDSLNDDTYIIYISSGFRQYFLNVFSIQAYVKHMTPHYGHF